MLQGWPELFLQSKLSPVNDGAAAQRGNLNRLQQLKVSSRHDIGSQQVEKRTAGKSRLGAPNHAHRILSK
jgi:hypothetical protein